MVSTPLLNKAHSKAEQLKAIVSFAQTIASTILHGYHKRKRAGVGSDFWQFRNLIDGEDHTHIDWRKSARSDNYFIREHELESSRKICFGLKATQSMTQCAVSSNTTKHLRGILIVAALSYLLKNSQDLFVAVGSDPSFKQSNAHIETLVSDLIELQDKEFDSKQFETSLALLSSKSKTTFIVSDFFEDLDNLETSLKKLGSNIVLIQIIDRSELEFPFKGALKFEALDNLEGQEFLKVESIKDTYLEAFDHHQEQLQKLAKRYNAIFMQHVSDEDIVPFLFEVIERMNDHGV